MAAFLWPNIRCTALTLAPEQMNRLYECGSYAKANDSTPDSSHLEKRPMRLPPIAIAEMRADKIRVNREHGGDPRRAHGMFLRAKLSAAFREQVDMRSQLATEERIMEVLSNSPKPSVSKGELTRSLSKRQKASLDAALENLMASGKIKHRKGMKGGHWYSLA